MSATAQPTSGTDSAASAAIAAIDAALPQLVALAGSLHATPELGFDEHHAHDRLCELLEGAGYAVTRAAYGLATAFDARIGTDGPRVAFLAEYDALPGLGHACGHNVIAAIAAGAAVGAGAVAAAAGGQVVVLGTPAEEGGGGKVHLIDRGAFDGLAAALMVHPADADLTNMDTLAISQADVTYHGVAAHAAAAPHLGRNALDAAVLGYQNVAALRQHILPTERVHGIFTDGGSAANVVPATAAATWFVRSPTTAGLNALKERVVACLTAGADAAGCSIEISWPRPTYAEMDDDPLLVERYVAHASRLGRTVAKPGEARVAGSTDMGNVSQVVPSIHPMIAIAPPGVAIHTADFARAAGGPEAALAIEDGAKALALIALDLWQDPELVRSVRDGHARRRAADA